jgi:hypothetical protein
VSLLQGVVSVWLVKLRVKDGPDFRTAYTEADRLGALAHHARLRAHLVAGDKRIMASADAAFGLVDALPHARDREELARQEQKILGALNEFISVAKDEIQ